jgi:WhiB family transcriptional regulator, redox-sensing transcriptional regulator
MAAHMSWQDQARCIQYDPEIFFDPRAKSERRAKSICAKCPVRDRCLSMALESGTEFGVWGGMNGKERSVALRRNPVLRERAIAQRPVATVTA